MNKCPECDYDVKKGSAKCPHCGAPMPKGKTMSQVLKEK